MLNTEMITLDSDIDNNGHSCGIYCVECGAQTELDCICDEQDQQCNCGAHNEI